ncbi:penicillin binding protein PBP4B [Pseudactinotalea sp. HY160]|uniref:penicillin binding protein PBP4B n=1 Tax=Pseudactinotalea sp. HY160 TaxID=2654490 RepID=UPI00128C7315|nr:penicillin binding protein PBP4B [Pseudactinotalea sp. HY160]MPV50495.1 penicillin binding protein PBP4B [Pseudactinotalea sp. HY160]
MFRSRGTAIAAVAGLGVSLLIAAPAGAAETTTLTVHYYSATGSDGDLEALTLGGAAPTAMSTDEDSFGTVAEFAFAGEHDRLGVRASGDSRFPEDLRYVEATDGAAEVWLIDGDARAYGAPQTLDADDVTTSDRKAFIAVEDLTDVLDLTYSYGRNGYVFDGAPADTLDILTIFRNRDYYEIAVDTNRIGQNVTGNMISYWLSEDYVFSDIDGYSEGGEYYLSFGAIEWLFQVRTLIHSGDALVLTPQFVAHDELTTADPAAVGFDPVELASLDDWIQDQVDAGGPAVGVVVTKDGKVVKNDAYGYALRYSTGVDEAGDLTPAELLPESEWEPATTDTLFDLASNSKMYATNYAIQRLVSEGRLDLDATVASFPGWEDFTDANSDYTGKWTVGGAGGITAVHTGKETVTVRDLLHHEGGLIPDPEYPNRASAGDLWYQTDDPDDRAGIIDAISRTPLMYAPRTRFAYSDVDFMILGLLVEQITGERLDVYLENEFYGPLGLEATTFRPLASGFAPEEVAATELNGNTRDGNVSFGTLPNGDPVPMRHYTLQGEVHDEKAFYSMAGVAGHAGLFSTTGDMAVLTQLMLNRGSYGGEQYFDADVADEFTTPHAVGGGNADSSTIALGWRVHSKNAAAYYYFNWGPSRETYGHQGWTGTLTIIDPLHQLTITILTNMRHSPVTSPPNGFAGANYAVADLVPISARVYRALTGESVQFTPAASVAAVDDVTVAHGTSLEDAIGALASSTTLTDADGGEWDVALSWELPGYDGRSAGDYEAIGTFDLPDGITPGEPAISTEVRATVTVADEPTAPTDKPTDPTDEPTDGAQDADGTSDAGGTDAAAGTDGTDATGGTGSADSTGSADGTIPPTGGASEPLPSTGASAGAAALLATLVAAAGVAVLLGRRHRVITRR